MAIVPQDVIRIFESIGTEAQCIRSTDLYNEGWLLRLLLALAFRGIDCLPFRIEPGSRWYSEALLPSAFRPNSRNDKSAESRTHADAVVGQFGFAIDTKAGLALDDPCNQFVVCEAKMFSRLSQGTKNSPSYDQAARTVGCMAEVLRESGRPISDFRSLGFFVFAPQSEIASGDFLSKVNRESIRKRLEERVFGYDGKPAHSGLKTWLDRWALPLIDRVELGCHSWESIIGRIERSNPDEHVPMSQFYENCLRQN